MFDFLNIQKTIAQVREQVVLLETKVQKKRKEIEHYKTAPLQASDVCDLLDDVIDAKAAEYDVALAHAINRINGDPGSSSRTNGIQVITAAPPGIMPAISAVEASICALLGEELKSALKKRIHALHQTENSGPLLKDRPAMIDAAQRELNMLEERLADLRKTAATSGLLV